MRAYSNTNTHPSNMLIKGIIHNIIMSQGRRQEDWDEEEWDGYIAVQARRAYHGCIMAREFDSMAEAKTCLPGVAYTSSPANIREFQAALVGRYLEYMVTISTESICGCDERDVEYDYEDERGAYMF